MNFLTLILSASPNMHFVRTFSIMRAYGVRLIAIKEARNYRKIVFSKMDGGRIQIPLILLLDPPLAISYKNHLSLAYFSHLAVLAPLILLFLPKGRINRRGRGGRWHNAPERKSNFTLVPSESQAKSSSQW